MESAIVTPNGWRKRLIAVYEDRRPVGAPQYAELLHVLSVIERKDDFPPDLLDSLPYPLVRPESEEARALRTCTTVYRSLRMRVRRHALVCMKTSTSPLVHIRRAAFRHTHTGAHARTHTYSRGLP